MKYIALLRGINVGGQNVIRMAALKSCLEQQGFANVTTFIASGNVVFETLDTNAPKLRHQVETALSRSFGYESRIVLRSQAQLTRVVADAPTAWKTRKNLRCNVVFLREPVTAREALTYIKVAPGIDFVEPGRGVLYCSTLLSGVKKSRFTRVIGTPIYRQMTIRNYNTCRKILALMER
jgi:uncharacterized protein (DUF1697 family)